MTSADIGKPADALAFCSDAAHRRLPRSCVADDRGTRGDARPSGDRDAARRGFDNAEHLLPADSDDPTMPYLSLSITHLVRWRGHGLALLRSRSHRLPHPSPR